jgi:hypothetical protein
MTGAAKVFLSRWMPAPAKNTLSRPMRRLIASKAIISRRRRSVSRVSKISACPTPTEDSSASVMPHFA